MLGARQFQKQPMHFWANVRTIGQQVGYTVRTKAQIKVPSFGEIRRAFTIIGLTSEHIADVRGRPTLFGRTLMAHFEYRAHVLNTFVEPRLMDVARATKEFERLRRKRRKSSCPIPMNKQKGDKRAPAYFTAMINLLIEQHSCGLPCDYVPRALTTITSGNTPLRTLARRVDGAFPSPINPIAIWEIKEYYYTTTFGSRVADGVYESLLDGMELEELREHEDINVKHYLMIDAHYTWWQCGRSYLCRILDMLHMGYIDEVLFGLEIFERLPTIVNEWVELAKK